jgi:twinkle protein
MIFSARDISKQLASRAESYCRFLLPNGKLNGPDWCVGSVDGEQGKSLHIAVTGPNAGLWLDFAAGGLEKGDLITLTKEIKKCSIREAIQAAKEWLGIRTPDNYIPKKTYRKLETSAVPQSPVAASAAQNYLMEQRMIDGLTQAVYKISESTGKNGPEVAFPFYSPEGEVENVKRLAVKRQPDGKKIMSMETGCAPALFGWQAIPPDAREVLICEGEIDAMTWFQHGFPALSVPNGAGSTDNWIDYEWERLEQFDTIWLAYDNDAPGNKGAIEAARRLGIHRCFIVHFPIYKDANEALQQGETENYFASCIAAAKPLEPEQIRSPAEFRDKVLEKFYPPEGTPPGFFPRILGQRLGLRPGEVTVWTGITSHGKTILLTQLMLEAVMKGHKVAIASMEMKPEQTLHRLLCQSEAIVLPSREVIAADLDWLSGRLWLYNVFGNVGRKLLMELLEYSYSRHGVRMFVIDSLMKTDIVSDDYNGQREFLNELCKFAMQTDSHINLVAHARKGKDEFSAPGKLDIKGSSDITNQPDNVITVWRNREKEKKRESGECTKEALEHMPDAIAYCEKQRETGLEFAMWLRFFKGVYRYDNMESKDFYDLKISSRVEWPDKEDDTPAYADLAEAPSQSEFRQSNDP